MKEEVLHRKISKENPFRVPDGYFESFSDRIMQQLPCDNETAEAPTEAAETAIPSHATISLFTRIKPYLYLAAMFAGLYFGIYVFKYQASMHGVAETKTADMPALVFASEEDVDEMFNFAMVDKEAIYDYLAEEY